MPRPRTWIDKADKQSAYRERLQDKRDEERQLSERAKGLLTIAAERGQVLDTSAPLWAQLDELAEWLRAH
jgi:hypothetical protein